MNQGILTVTFYDWQADSDVTISHSLLSPQEALEARDLWLKRFAALHLEAPTFDYDGSDYEGIWEDA